MSHRLDTREQECLWITLSLRDCLNKVFVLKLAKRNNMITGRKTVDSKLHIDQYPKEYFNCVCKMIKREGNEKPETLVFKTICKNNCPPAWIITTLFPCFPTCEFCNQPCRVYKIVSVNLLEIFLCDFIGIVKWNSFEGIVFLLPEMKLKRRFRRQQWINETIYSNLK